MRSSWARYIAASALMVVSTALASPPPLRWGADTSSGAPFAFQDAESPDRLLGFEVDIIQELGRRLGRGLAHVQNNWEALIPGLLRGEYDVVLSGIEVTEERKKQIGLSIPYYVTYQALTVRTESKSVETLHELVGRSVGTLKASASQKLLDAVSGIDVRNYDDEVNAFRDLELKRIDAVFMDFPMALYYGGTRPLLKILPKPFGRVEYGIALRSEEVALRLQLDNALKQMIREGALRNILEDWNLWTPALAQDWQDFGVSNSVHPAYDRFVKNASRSASWQDKAEQYWGFREALFRGALLTLKISVSAMALAVVWGLLLALGRLYGPPPIQWLSMAYVEVVRGTPLFIQLLLIFYGLPSFGIQWSPWTSALIGLGLNYGACEAENYRAGLLSVPKGQLEGALALGMSRKDALIHVMLPQAVRLVIPPVTNDFIALLKDSALVSALTLVELTKVYQLLASATFDYLGIGLLVATIYFFLGLPFVRLARWLEKRQWHRT